ncbi:hypothetical protein VNO80_13323 [Phaseolus coccineus]|uniref:Uncharacterized protein n=1 Tax=Phaseolus coccineus TaxID=3886 RepID=A0AAN9N2T0_PHACN
MNMEVRGSEVEGSVGEVLGTTTPLAIGRLKLVLVFPNNTSGEVSLPLETEGHKPSGTIQNGNNGDGGSFSIAKRGEAGCGGLLGLERWRSNNEEEEAIVEEGYKMPKRVRRLKNLWEQATKNVRPRWRSNGGLGSLHCGISSPSRLSLCFKADFDNDIIHCNSWLRNEESIVESTRI